MSRLRLIVAGLLVPPVALAAFLLVVTLTGFRPPARQDVAASGSGYAQPLPHELSLLSWNIGYAGLGAEADFFYDGGRMARGRDQAAVQRHLGAIRSFLAGKKFDFVLLQEVDRDSARSYGIDEFPFLQACFPGHCALFSYNYRVLWVPLPLTRPMGGVNSGLALFSRWRVEKSERVALPGRFPWPTRLFIPRRCLLVARLPLAGPCGELVLINLHNSTFDKQGQVRRRELYYLKRFILREYGRGHAVIVGGDWNHHLPGSADSRFPASDPRPEWAVGFPPRWTPPGWRWAVDARVATVRATASPYRAGKNYRSVIDGFLVSPGIRILSVHGVDLGFADSDHNPVQVRVRLPLPPEKPGPVAVDK